MLQSLSLFDDNSLQWYSGNNGKDLLICLFRQFTNSVLHQKHFIVALWNSKKPNRLLRNKMIRVFCILCAKISKS